MTKDEKYMQYCLELASRGKLWVAPNPMVGAALVDNEGNIAGSGWHQQYGSAHAEVNAFKDFHLRYGADATAEDLTLYVSLEPCSHFGKTPPCADLIIREGVKHVVVGSLDPNPLVSGNGVRKLKEADVDVHIGVLEEQCRYLNRRFICLYEKKRPYVILKWAQTADGFIAPRNQSERFVISTPQTKRIVHQMRAENMAIMVGTNTALLDNPKLTVTHAEGRNPIRILLDRHNRVPRNYNIFSDEAETIVYSDDTDWHYILSDLAQRGIHSVLVEGGAALLNHIIGTDIYDEVHVEINPNIHLYDGIAAPKIAIEGTPEIVDGNLLYSF